MRIMGLDPGTTIIGFACIEIHLSTITLVEYGCICTESKTALSTKLGHLGEEFEKLIKRLHPDEIAIENIYFAQNVKTGIAVAHARGVLMYIGGKNKLDIFEYSPNEVKMAITGDGHANKSQIQKMVQLICNLESLPRQDDAADALAIALCHSQYMNINARLKTTNMVQ